MIEFEIKNVHYPPGVTHALFCTGLDEIVDFEEGLRAAIKKWAAVVEFYTQCPEALLIAGGRSTCGLCQASTINVGEVCGGCPVMNETGRSCCNDTPHNDYGDALYDRDPVAAKKAAVAELKFLESL